jgi:hypothetical protein
MLTPGTGHVVHADARALPFPAATFDSALCDPPYELAFMGRAWDATGVAYNPATWREAARVLRPGGWLLAFGGTRTWHRLVCAIEDGGFEVRDTIAWIYGSGYPKSRNSLKPAFEPIVVARKPTGGLASILNNLDIDGCGIGTGLRTNPAAGNRAGGAALNMSVAGMPADVPARETVGRWPSNLILTHMPTYDDHGQPNGDACADGCVPGCPVAALDAQTGWTASNGAGGATPRTGGAATNLAMSLGNTTGYRDEGGASRFFPTFRYEAKAPTDERPVVDGVQHNTVKPLDLMRWLCRLVAGTGSRRILDPFAGSGTTIEAAIHEGLTAYGCDTHRPYLPLIRYRIDRAGRRTQPGILRLGNARPVTPLDGQLDLFGME